MMAQSGGGRSGELLPSRRSAQEVYYRRGFATRRDIPDGDRALTARDCKNPVSPTVAGGSSK